VITAKATADREAVSRRNLLYVTTAAIPAEPTDVTGGYGCPCCASHFDPAGRAHAGPAQYNLPVSPYEVVKSRLVIGRNASDALFTLESIERM
jgi:hypothetical protein